MSTDASNQAAWLDEKGAKLRVGEAPMPRPGDDGIVIKAKAISINPVDWKMQDYGMFVQKWPTILGCDVAGEVVAVGENVKRFKRSDRVAAHLTSLATGDTSGSGFQHYVAAPAATTAILPDNVSFNEGVVFPLALDTAAVGLCGKKDDGFLGLPLPSLEPASSDQVIFLWGGSSSVGLMVIQVAKAAGAKVVTVASRHNYELCKSVGASEVIDYRSPSVVDDVVAAVKNLGGTFAGTYDAIATKDTFNTAFSITEKLGGTSYACVLPPPEEGVPEGIKAGGIFAVNPLAHPIWADFVTKALEGGQLKALPEPQVVGKGLEKLQAGMDENKKGVSARKVIVEI